MNLERDSGLHSGRLVTLCIGHWVVPPPSTPPIPSQPQQSHNVRSVSLHSQDFTNDRFSNHVWTFYLYKDYYRSRLSIMDQTSINFHQILPRTIHNSKTGSPGVKPPGLSHISKSWIFLEHTRAEISNSQTLYWSTAMGVGLQANDPPAGGAQMDHAKVHKNKYERCR